jgi:dipicolinate synthase subunit A
LNSTEALLAGTVVAVVGGDAREQEIARLAAEAGASVRAYGFPWPPRGIAGAHLCTSAAEAMEGADIALFPVPGMGEDGSLFAPAAPVPIVPAKDLLSLLRPGALVVLGRANEQLRAAANAVGVALSEYEDDPELMLLRAPAVVEGVVSLAISNSDVTLHANAAGVVGFGKVGGALARTLVSLGSSVHVFARDPVQRAAAYAACCRAHPLEQLASVAPELSFLFSTVPAKVVGEAALERLPRGSLVVDLAAPPGGVDLPAAEHLGLRAVWARGMGASAPVTVGRSQWTGVLARVVGHRRRHRSQI